MTITSVDQLVQHLQATGHQFELDAANQIREHGVCPLFALMPCFVAGDDVPFELVEAVVNAADDAEGHDPAVRQKLLQLVPIAVGA